MNLEVLSFIALICAAIPCVLFALNLLVYRPLGCSRRREEAENCAPPADPPPYVGGYGVSVLIPARNEEQNIRATLESVLANREAEFEVVVLDDHSSDRTAEIVGEFARRDSRVRLESAPPLPVGWCGKQHACHVLAGLARYPLLVFMDADVRLAPDALARMAAFMWRQASLPPVEPGFQPGGTASRNRTGLDFSAVSAVRESIPGGKMPPSTTDTDARRYVALASGVPRQELGTFSERLLIPQIHFILLGFLPMHAMRRTPWPAMSAGCGQLFIVRRDAYEHCGGHAMLRDSLHDGIKLPRAFRRAGWATDLFDATDLATCRMYHTNGETWRGLGKNATEGLAAPATIFPMTALLLGGQVLPFGLVLFAAQLSSVALWATVLAGAFAYAPRLLAVKLFRQPLGSALLHPLGVVMLLAIQWLAFVRQFAGKPAVWKGRSYGTDEAALPVKAT